MLINKASKTINKADVRAIMNMHRNGRVYAYSDGGEGEFRVINARQRRFCLPGRDDLDIPELMSDIVRFAQFKDVRYLTHKGHVLALFPLSESCWKDRRRGSSTVKYPLCVVT
jgi:hypothetical protein